MVDYIIAKDAVTLFICKKENLRKISPQSIIKRMSFLMQALKLKRKALEKFEKHQASKSHQSATTLKFMILQCGNVMEMIDS